MRIFFVLVCFWVLSWPVFGVTMKAVEEWDIEGWFGLNSDFSIITQSDLDRILEEHGKWMESKKKEEKKDKRRWMPERQDKNYEGKRADLDGVNFQGLTLQYLNLEGVSLRKANLKGALLNSVSLKEAELEGIILEGAELRKVNFEKAKLRKAKLKGADLWKINLKKADLWEADLDNTLLIKVDFKEALLLEVKLKGALLREVNFERASLKMAILEGACLSKVNFKGASLVRASLIEANFKVDNSLESFLFGDRLAVVNSERRLMELEPKNETIFKKNRLIEVNFEGTLFELQSKKIPNIQSLAGIKRLHLLTYSKSPHSLIEVQKAFKEIGFRSQERELTYAIHHNRIQKESSFFEKHFCYIFFELPCGWGMNFARPIGIIVILILLFSNFYMEILFKRTKRDGIWKIWHQDRVRTDLGGKKPELLRLKNWDVIKYGLYFSFLSAFHIGWREFNIGSWISKIQPQEYALRATGKARVISGVQSLISVYLLALSILAYFGRPFD